MRKFFSIRFYQSKKSRNQSETLIREKDNQVQAAADECVQIEVLPDLNKKTEEDRVLNLIKSHEVEIQKIKQESAEIYQHQYAREERLAKLQDNLLATKKKREELDVKVEDLKLAQKTIVENIISVSAELEQEQRKHSKAERISNKLSEENDSKTLEYTKLTSELEACKLKVDDLNKYIKKTEAKNRELEIESHDTYYTLRTFSDQRTDLQARLTELQDKQDSLNDKLLFREKRMEKFQAQLRELKDNIKFEQKNVDVQRRKMTDSEGTLHQIKVEIKEKTELLEKYRVDSLRQQEKVEKNMQNIREAEEALLAVNLKLDSEKNKFEKISTQVAEGNDKLVSIKKEIIHKEQAYSELQKDNIEKHSILKALNKRLASYSKNSGLAHSKMQKISSEVARITDLIATAQRELKNSTAAAGNMQQQIVALEKQRQTDSNKLVKFEKEAAQATQSLHELQRKYERKKKQLSTLVNHVETEENKTIEIKLKIRELQKVIGLKEIELASLKDAVAGKKEESQFKNKQLESSTAQLTSLDNECAELKQTLQDLELIISQQERSERSIIAKISSGQAQRISLKKDIAAKELAPMNTANSVQTDANNYEFEASLRKACSTLDPLSEVELNLKGHSKLNHNVIALVSRVTLYFSNIRQVSIAENRLGTLKLTVLGFANDQKSLNSINDLKKLKAGEYSLKGCSVVEGISGVKATFYLINSKRREARVSF